ncbi:ABC transporter permease [Schaalia canis]|uniref:FtsX-like permease family protein n=1 Tax=Schaalia canis TaxID=100469 RepID=A0A3P1SJG1_9ACTO|nr:FtsX-like permease family protein [Schaalia canis]RRC96462.1 FtsX-like permease family protein [Schaalia canis]
MRTQRPRVLWPFLREIILSCRAQLVTSLVVLLIAGGAVGAVLGTAGLSAAAQSKVLSTVDNVGTRSISIYSTNPTVPLEPSILDALERLDIVESAIGFSVTVDVVNAEVNAGKRVGARLVYGGFARELLERASTHAASHYGDGLAGFATPDAYDLLGLPAEGGGVRVAHDGKEITVIGDITLPEHLAELSPTILVPVERPEGLSAIFLAARSADELPLLTELVRGQMRGYTSQEYNLATSQAYASLRAAIDGELTASSHSLIVGVLGAGAGATMLVVWAVVLLRRKDLGRRRALGASRLMIIGLTVGQVAVLTLLGAGIGAGVASAIMVALGQPVPPWDFHVAVSVALVSASTLLCIVPALWAAQRDPLTELRVP